MRRGKKLTREAKIKLDKLGLDPDDYCIAYKDDRQIICMEKATGEIIIMGR